MWLLTPCLSAGGAMAEGPDSHPGSAQSAPDLFAPGSVLNFVRITVDDGLPENSVRAMLQDSAGFLWFGTQNGLVRYDGLNMIVYSPSTSTGRGFTGRTILAMNEDREGRIWIGTLLRGLWVHDPRQDTFESVDLGGCGVPERDPITSLAIGEDGRLWVAANQRLISLDVTTREARLHDRVTPPGDWESGENLTSLLADRQGRVWCATGGKGVAVYEPSGTCEWYRHRSGDRASIAADVVHDVYEDASGRIWLASERGLSQWQETSRDFRNFSPGIDPGAPGAELFVRLAGATHDLLWIGSANGLYLFDPEPARFRRFAHDRRNPFSPVNGPVLSLLVDRSGVLWAGSWHTGLNKADPRAGRFRVEEFPARDASAQGASVEAIHEDRQGRLWVGTSDLPRGRGLGRVYVVDPRTRDIRAVESAESEVLPSVLSIAEDSAGTIWLGTYEGLWSVESGSIAAARLGSGASSDALAHAAVQTISFQPDGTMWIATWSGLFRWRSADSRLDHFEHDATDPESLAGDVLTTLCIDRHGRIWVGTDTNGLNLVDPASGRVTRYFDPEQGLETVTDIHEDEAGVLWLATFSGLVRFDPATGSRQVFDRTSGLANDEVVSVLADDAHHLWLSTGFGLSRFDVEALDCLNYDTGDGLPDNEVRFARLRTRDGRLYFGGAQNLLSFDPSEFLESTWHPDVLITGIAVSDTLLSPGPGSALSVAAPCALQIDLSHDRNDLTFSFASLDFARPERNRYRYRLEGYDEDWRVPSHLRSASYTNLPPGHFTFRVRGSNRDGVFGEREAALAVVIHPPLWRTAPAWTLYLMLSVLLLWLARRMTMQRARMRTQIEIQRARATHLQELDDLKSRLLTNITHEFRTPLTLIKAHLSRIGRGDDNTEDQERIDNATRNADRLEELIDQLLDLSRLEAGGLPIHFAPRSCMAFLRVLGSSFESLFGHHGIDLVCDFPEEDCEVWVDTDALEKIVGNLLSNAVKYTPSGGTVTFRAHLDADVRELPVPVGDASKLAPGGPRDCAPARDLLIAIRNTGAYLTPEVRTMVFERFYRASRVGGSGVGLALVRELTQWLGGAVDVESSADEGTCFTVRLPVFLVHPGQDSVRHDGASPLARRRLDGGSEDRDAGVLADAGLGTEPRVLVVEDHAEMREFICKELSEEYRVLAADTGPIGLELAIAEIPDLVLSDVMMPGLDGFELCRRLKQDPRTSHVPVILLTALSEAESRHHGLREGADDYLAKPFDADELLLRIGNLIEQRRRLAERYAALGPGDPGVPHASSADRFVSRVREVIDANLDDPEFRISALCRAVGVSRSQLHRKLKAVTGRTTSDFVRTHRLQRAAGLLEADYGNVTEVAYAVGFQSLSYFSRSFRDLYGVQPSEYLRGRRTNGGPTIT